MWIDSLISPRLVSLCSPTFSGPEAMMKRSPNLPTGNLTWFGHHNFYGKKLRCLEIISKRGSTKGYTRCYGSGSNSAKRTTSFNSSSVTVKIWKWFHSNQLNITLRFTYILYIYINVYIYTLVSVLLQNSPQKKICVSVRRGKTTVTAAGRGGWWTPLRIFDSPSPLYWSCHFKNNGHMHLRTYIYIVQYVSRVYVVVRYVYTVCMYNYLYIYIWKFITFFLGGGNRT